MKKYKIVKHYNTDVGKKFHLKRIWILFGEMGTGKNYWGEKLAKAHKIDFFDGDLAVPPAMIEKVSKFQPLTREMVANYIHKILAPEIIKRARESKGGLVVSQALYNDLDRIRLAEYLEAEGFDVMLHWIKAPIFRNIKQLLTRENGYKWVVYYLINKPYFQKPSHSFWAINEKLLSEF
jgi:gluconate kinase